MTREEAKLILQSFRPNGQDAGDPFFAEALALAKTDSELGAWFAEQQKFDMEMGREIKGVEVPFDLKKKILAQEDEITAATGTPFEWWRNVFSWRAPATWAMACGCVLIFAGIALLGEPENRFADYQAAMISASHEETNHVEVLNSNLPQVESLFAARSAQTNIDVPVGMRGGGLMGCRVLDWHGKKVSMLCFVLNGSKHVDLFVADLGKISDAPLEGVPQFAKNGPRTTASWGENGKVYLMTGDVDENFLRQCLKPSTAFRLYFQWF